jgi:hypothetical protein
MTPRMAGTGGQSQDGEPRLKLAGSGTVGWAFTVVAAAEKARGVRSGRRLNSGTPRWGNVIVTGGEI